MSTPALQLRERLPRLAEEAVARARLTVVPRRRVRAARMPFVTLVSLVLLGGVVGLLCFNTQMQQASFAATSLETQSDNLAAREQTLHDELAGPARPAAPRCRGARRRDGRAAERLHASGSPPRPPTKGCAAATAGNTPPLLARAPKKPTVLDPDPIVVTVPPPAGSGGGGTTATATTAAEAASRASTTRRAADPIRAATEQDSPTRHSSHIHHISTRDTRGPCPATAPAARPGPPGPS